MKLKQDVCLRCLISSFYIKPQPIGREKQTNLVVLYLHSTSNHNCKYEYFVKFTLSYIFILHQTTTKAANWSFSNLLSYIFILHQTTTAKDTIIFRLQLSYIFILHQTTTVVKRLFIYRVLSYIFILHQTTTIRSFPVC